MSQHLGEIKYSIMLPGYPSLSVGNPRDQMTKYTEFVTVFSSASGRIF